MRFTLTIKCDNDAFADAADLEVCRILKKTAQTIESFGYSLEQCLPVFDANGQKVGEWSFTEETPDE